MTSRDYRSLCLGGPDEAQISEYIHLRKKIDPNDIQQRELDAATPLDPDNYLLAIQRSNRTHHEVVWAARRELVAKMKRTTLEFLAKYYGISPGTECVRDHPDANDLDKGLLLARLRRFLWWDGEYHGTAPEMLKIDVEKAVGAARGRTGAPQPTDTAPLESVLRYASVCKNASSSTLLQALKECIAVECVCPAIEHDLTLKIKVLAEQADYLRGQVHDLEKYCKAPGEQAMVADAQHKDTGQLINDLGETLKDLEDRSKVPGNAEDDDDVIQTITDLKTSTQKLKSSYNNTRFLNEVCAYRAEFMPGKVMPETVNEATDKWFAAQFAEGKPVGSIVRVAWLTDVFHSFWEQHQSAYLALNPSQREMQKKASVHGKQGVAQKADTKWRSFTAQFVNYIDIKEERPNTPSAEKINALITEFGEHLINQKIKGASDKRTVGHIKEYISTLAILTERNADEDEVRITWKRLSRGGADQRKEKVSDKPFFDDHPIHAKQGPRASAEKFKSSADDSSTHADKKLRGNKGKFRSSAFSSLPLETFKECLEILRSALQHRKVQSGAGGRPKQGRKKI